MSGSCGPSCCGGSGQAQTITKDELKQHLSSVQVVNVLDPKHYGEGMIQGSKKIPLAELERRLGELDKTRPVVTYCYSPECDASSKAAVLLAGKGFTVRAYEGGITEWKAAGLPTEPAAPVAAGARSSCC